MEDKKIVFFQASLGTGGATRSNLKIASLLAKEFRNVIFVYGNGTKEAIDLVPKTINTYSLSAYTPFQSLIKFSKYLREHNPDLIFGGSLQNNIIAIIAKEISRVKAKLVTIDGNPPTNPQCEVTPKSWTY